MTRRRPCTAIAIGALVSLSACGPASSSVSSVSSVRSTAPAAVLPTVTTAAAATTTAVRLDPPRSECQRVAAAIAARHPEVTQLLVVRTEQAADTIAVVQLADRRGSGWACGDEMTGRVGRNGVRPLPERRSGDGTTPAGVFPLATMTAHDGQRFSFFGNGADPGVTAGAYRAVRAGDCFGATPNTADYGHLVERSPSSCRSPDEYLPSITGAYVHAALIGANMEPDVSGDGPGEVPYASAIFLHRHSYGADGSSRPTSGCVSLALDDLVPVLRAMQPDVMFAIGTTEWLETEA